MSTESIEGTQTSKTDQCCEYGSRYAHYAHVRDHVQVKMRIKRIPDTHHQCGGQDSSRSTRGVPPRLAARPGPAGQRARSQRGAAAIDRIPCWHNSGGQDGGSTRRCPSREVCPMIGRELHKGVKVQTWVSMVDDLRRRDGKSLFILQFCKAVPGTFSQLSRSKIARSYD